MRRLVLAFSLAAMTGCTFLPREQPTTVVVQPTVVTQAAPPASPQNVPLAVIEEPVQAVVVESDHEFELDDVDPAAVQRVLVLQSRQLPRPAEVLGIVDAHEPTGSERLALLVLRRNAARMGADAVVGVEFHHAESPGEPLHLSGLAVRFIEWR